MVSRMPPVLRGPRSAPRLEDHQRSVQPAANYGIDSLSLDRHLAHRAALCDQFAGRAAVASASSMVSGFTDKKLRGRRCAPARGATQTGRPTLAGPDIGQHRHDREHDGCHAGDPIRRSGRGVVDDHEGLLRRLGCFHLWCVNCYARGRRMVERAHTLRANISTPEVVLVSPMARFARN